MFDTPYFYYMWNAAKSTCSRGTRSFDRKGESWGSQKGFVRFSAHPRESATHVTLGGPELDGLLGLAEVLFVPQVRQDNVRQVFKLLKDGRLLGVKLEAVLVNTLLGQLADDIQNVVEFLVGMTPMRDVGDGGESGENDSLLEVVVALEMMAELEDIAHRVLDGYGLGGVGDSLKEALQLAAEAVVDGN